MSDIKHMIVNDDPNDVNGNLHSLADWSEDIARTLAAEEKIDLTDDHLDIIKQMRNHYRDNQPWDSARTVQKLMEQSIQTANPRQRLYQLFPEGPVKQACKIGGLPVPANASDASFGSVR